MKPAHSDPRFPLRRKPRQVALATIATAALLIGGATTAHAAGGVAPQATQPTAKTVTLNASDTATVSARTPKTALRTQALSATSTQDRSYARFSLPADADTTKPVRVTLALTVRHSTANAAGLDVYVERGAWSSSTLTYANRPTEAGSRISQSAPVAKKGTPLSVSLGDVAKVITKGQLSLRLSYRQKYISTQYTRTGTGAPTLKVTYTPKAAAQPAPTVPPTQQPQPPTQPAPPTQPTQPVPADTGREVFAHYFPPYPLSIDNKPADNDYYTRNYLVAGGEGGKHASYGGLLRDRPEPVTPSASSSWRIENLQREVRQAKDAGIDGFTVNIMSFSGMNWDATKNLFTAAQREGGFTVVPMIDVSASAGGTEPATVADRLAELYSSPAVYRVDGRLLLSSFAAEKQSVGWWKQVIDRLRNVHRLPITFQAVFLNASDANMNAFAGIADGYGNWGVRTEWHTLNGPDYAARAAALGKTWIAPVSVQDYRPRAAVFAESGNTDNLRASWKRAIDSGAKYVQLVTWNDYSESTQFAPSADHGETFLDASRPYLDWFHTGTEPKITQDQAFLTHRTQRVGAAPLLTQLLATPTLGGTSVAPVDEVEALVYLTAPAKVTITVGGVSKSFDAPAGRSSFAVPLRTGTASVAVARSGRDVISLSSPYRIVDRPEVQDLSYYGVTSLG